MVSSDASSIAHKLNEISVFRGFKSEELQRLVTFGRVLKINAGAHAVIEGDPSRGLYLILKGHASVHKTDVSNGKLVRIAHLEEGVFFGELSLFDSGPRSATVEADVEMEVYVLDAEDFESFLKKEGAALELTFYRTCAVDLAKRFRVLNQEYVNTQKLLWKQAFSK